MAQNEYLVDGADMTAVADAIRERSGTTAPLSFPDGMAAAVRNIQSAGGNEADINIDDYIPNCYQTILSNIMTGSTEIAMDISNAESFWEIINKAAGNIRIDLDMGSNGIYSAKLNGITKDANGNIFWADLKLSAYITGQLRGWISMYVGFNGGTMLVKVTDIPST